MNLRSALQQGQRDYVAGPDATLGDVLEQALAQGELPPAAPRRAPGIYADPSMEADDVRRYAHLWDKDFMQTLTEIPLGGVLRALAENKGWTPEDALMLERVGAGVGAAGVGTAGALLAAQILNGDDQPIIVRG
jgi:hypothetical protein